MATAVIGISVPNGAPSHAAITFFAERINAMGISRDQILVATHDAANGDARVEINYISYRRNTDACGDWSEDLAFTMDNQTAQEFRLRGAAQYRRPDRRSARSC